MTGTSGTTRRNGLVPLVPLVREKRDKWNKSKNDLSAKIPLCGKALEQVEQVEQLKTIFLKIRNTRANHVKNARIASESARYIRAWANLFHLSMVRRKTCLSVILKDGS